MHIYRFAFANILKSVNLPKVIITWLNLYVPLMLFCPIFLCCFCLKQPILTCLFYFTKWCVSISILFIICCSLSLSLCLFLTHSHCLSYIVIAIDFLCFIALFKINAFQIMESNIGKSHEITYKIDTKNKAKRIRVRIIWS